MTEENPVLVDGSHTVPATSPSDYGERVSRYSDSSAAPCSRDQGCESSGADSDSGNSLFLTQEEVPKAKRIRKPPRGLGYSSDARSLSKDDYFKEQFKKSRRIFKNVRVPRCPFPFIKGVMNKRMNNSLLPMRINRRLQCYASLGFLQCAKKLWEDTRKNHVLDLPTVDGDGGYISPLSEGEESSKYEGIKVVEKKCFVVPSKRKTQQNCNNQLEPQRTEETSDAQESQQKMIHETPSEVINLSTDTAHEESVDVGQGQQSPKEPQELDTATCVTVELEETPSLSEDDRPESLALQPSDELQVNENNCTEKLLHDDNALRQDEGDLPSHQDEGADVSFSNDAVTLSENVVVPLKKEKKTLSEDVDISRTPEENEKVENLEYTQKANECLEDTDPKVAKKKSEMREISSRNISEDGVAQSDEEEKKTLSEDVDISRTPEENEKVENFEYTQKANECLEDTDPKVAKKKSEMREISSRNISEDGVAQSDEEEKKTLSEDVDISRTPEENEKVENFEYTQKANECLEDTDPKVAKKKSEMREISSRNISEDGVAQSDEEEKKTLSEDVDISRTPEENEKVENLEYTQKANECLEDTDPKVAKKKSEMREISSRNISEDGVAQSDDSLSVQKKKGTSSLLVADAEETDVQSHVEPNCPLQLVDAHVWDAEKPVSPADLETESVEVAGNLEESNGHVRKKKRKMSEEHDRVEKDSEQNFEEPNKMYLNPLPENTDTEVAGSLEELNSRIRKKEKKGKMSEEQDRVEKDHKQNFEEPNRTFPSPLPQNADAKVAGSLEESNGHVRKKKKKKKRKMSEEHDRVEKDSEQNFEEPNIMYLNPLPENTDTEVAGSLEELNSRIRKKEKKKKRKMSEDTDAEVAGSLEELNSRIGKKKKKRKMSEDTDAEVAGNLEESNSRIRKKKKKRKMSEEQDRVEKDHERKFEEPNKMFPSPLPQNTDAEVAGSLEESNSRIVKKKKKRKMSEQQDRVEKDHKQNFEEPNKMYLNPLPENTDTEVAGSLEELNSRIRKKEKKKKRKMSEDTDAEVAGSLEELNSRVGKKKKKRKMSEDTDAKVAGNLEESNSRIRKKKKKRKMSEEQDRVEKDHERKFEEPNKMFPSPLPQNTDTEVAGSLEESNSRIVKKKKKRKMSEQQDRVEKDHKQNFEEPNKKPLSPLPQNTDTEVAGSLEELNSRIRKKEKKKKRKMSEDNDAEVAGSLEELNSLIGKKKKKRKMSEDTDAKVAGNLEESNSRIRKKKKKRKMSEEQNRVEKDHERKFEEPNKMFPSPLPQNTDTEVAGSLEELNSRIRKKEKKKKGKMSEDNDAKVAGNLEESNSRIRKKKKKGKMSEDNDAEVAGSLEELNSRIGKKKKKRKMSEDTDAKVAGNLEESNSRIRKKKKKGKMSEEQDRVEKDHERKFEEPNKMFPSPLPQNTDTEVVGSLEESNSRIVKKKKKRKMSEQQDRVEKDHKQNFEEPNKKPLSPLPQNTDTEVAGSLEESNGRVRKKKRKRKMSEQQDRVEKDHERKFEEPNKMYLNPLPENTDTEVAGSLEESNSRIRKKKKKGKMSEEQDRVEKDHERKFEEPNKMCPSPLPQNTDTEVAGSLEESNSRIGKKKKKRKMSEQQDRVEKDHKQNFEEPNKKPLSLLPDNTDAGLKRKKKRPTNESESVTTVERLKSSADVGHSPTDETVVLKKKKKKRKDEQCNVIQESLPAAPQNTESEKSALNNYGPVSHKKKGKQLADPLVAKGKHGRTAEISHDSGTSDQVTKETLNMAGHASPSSETPTNQPSNDRGDKRKKKKKKKSTDLPEGKSFTNSAELKPIENKKKKKERN